MLVRTVQGRWGRGLGLLPETGAGVVWTRGGSRRSPQSSGSGLTKGSVSAEEVMPAGAAWTTGAGEGPSGQLGRRLRVAKRVWRPGVRVRSEEADSRPSPRVFQGPRGHFTQTDMTLKLGLLRGDTFPPLRGACVIGSIRLDGQHGLRLLPAVSALWCRHHQKTFVERPSALGVAGSKLIIS